MLSLDKQTRKHTCICFFLTVCYFCPLVKVVVRADVDHVVFVAMDVQRGNDRHDVAHSNRYLRRAEGQSRSRVIGG